MLNFDQITRLFLHRQHLLTKATPVEYDELFRWMSPVSTYYWTRPGDPPVLVHRADFDDLFYNDSKRSNREIVKGRFWKSGVGYIRSDELELFAGLYRTDLGKITKQEFEILDLLEHEGSMNIRELKAVTGMFVKDITPILHRLQEAFRVYEDQRDKEWDRSWYAFENEFPEVNVKRYTKTEALKIVLLRFAHLHVFFDATMAKSFYRVTKKDIEMAIAELVAENRLIFKEFRGLMGYLLTEDVEFLEKNDLPEPSPSVLMMHRSDFIVKSHEDELKKRFSDKEHDVLYYLLIDGEFQGAVFGRFTFGPIELRKIKLDLSTNEIARRKTEILKAVYTEIDPIESPFPLICENDSPKT
jgi:hypothetical protein